jgi:hypothetical protein
MGAPTTAPRSDAGRPRTTAILVALAGALALSPAGAVAQRCGVVGETGAAAVAGYAHYEMAGGVDGWEVGADVAFAPGPLGARVGYRKLLIDGGDADPDVVRGTLAVPLAGLSGVATCALVEAGLSRYSAPAGEATSVAGGAGLAVALPLGLAAGGAVPFVAVRALHARTESTVLGVDGSGGGWSLGVEGGVSAGLGPLLLRLTGSVDGFDDTLGATPYPDRSVRLAVGFRF